MNLQIQLRNRETQQHIFLHKIERVLAGSHINLALIQNTVGKQQGFSLLDFGCGTGDFLGFVKQNKAEQKLICFENHHWITGSTMGSTQETSLSMQ